MPRAVWRRPRRWRKALDRHDRDGPGADPSESVAEIRAPPEPFGETATGPIVDPWPRSSPRAINSPGRSMVAADRYPFGPTSRVTGKLGFVRCLVRGDRTA